MYVICIITQFKCRNNFKLKTFAKADYVAIDLAHQRIKKSNQIISALYSKQY